MLSYYYRLRYWFEIKRSRFSDMCLLGNERLCLGKLCFSVIVAFVFGILGVSAQNSGLYDSTPIVWDFEESVFDSVTTGPNSLVDEAAVFDSTGWMLHDGLLSQMKWVQNRWAFSTYEAFVGKRCLLVSNDGTSEVPPPGYENTNSNLVLTASKTVLLPKGDYNFSMAWRCVGDVQRKDGLWVLWLPENLECLSGFKELSSAMTDRAIDFEKRGKRLLSRESYWQVDNGIVRSDGINAYKVVFVWVNDAANVVQPPAAVDFIQITPVDDCTKITSLDASSSAWTTDVGVSWKGKADKYQVQWRLFGNTDEPYLAETAQTNFRIENVEKGMYDFWVRGICGQDTGMWYTCRNVLVFSPGCIDYSDLYSPNVVCKYVYRPDPVQGNESIGGSNSFPPIDNAQWRTGVIDNGPDSMSSRHTVYSIPGQLDERTNYGLPTIPPGELVSVRLGNWNMGAEGESVTYTITVDSIYKIIVLKYAVVFQDPGHPIAEQPRFTMKIFDELGRPIGFSDCGSADFRPSTTLDPKEGWHEERFKIPGSEDDIVRWKEWTTVGVRVDEEYVGKKIRVELKTYDCEQGGHYGYAYFTLGCAEATISGIACGERQSQSISAPDGFEYRWYLKSDPDNTLSTTKDFDVEAYDTRTYSCDVNMIGKPYCVFTLDAVLEPRFPKANFLHTWKPSGCRNNDVYFHNASAVVSEDGIPQSGTRCDYFHWDVYDETGVNRIDTFSIPDNSVSPTVRFPKEGGKFYVKLTSGMSNGMCEDSIRKEIIVPRLEHDTIRVDTATCVNLLPIRIQGKLFNSSALDTIEWQGDNTCKQIYLINLTVADSIKIETFDTICQGEVYEFNGERFTESGTMYAQLATATTTSCDTSAVVHLEVIDSLIVEFSAFGDICSGDSLFVAPFDLIQGEYLDFEVLFDSIGLAVGFRDSSYTDPETREIVVYLPDSVRPDFYGFTMRCHTEKCGSKDFKVPFCVKYPETVIEQKWNDVIAVVNSRYNGGYEFESYEWYKNDVLIDGESRGYLYIGPAAEFDLSDEYRVALVRKGEAEKIMSCPLIPVVRTDKTPYIVRNMVSPGSVFQVPALDDGAGVRGMARWWSVSGQIVAEQEYDEWNNDVRAPLQQGVYLLELRMGNELLIVKMLVF